MDITYKSAPYSLSYFIFNSPKHKDSCTTYMNLYLFKSDFNLLGHIYLSIILKLLSPKIPQIDASSISIYSKNARFTTPSFTKSLVLSFPFPSHQPLQVIIIHIYYFNSLLADRPTYFQPLHTLSNKYKELPEFTTSICPLRNPQCLPTVSIPNSLAKCSR